MQCDYHDAGVCRSCTFMGTPYARQVADKDARVRAALAAVVPAAAWASPFTGPQRDFRTKAKLVAGGHVGAVTLGILGPDGAGVDLRECGIQDPRLREALPVLADWIDAARLIPYDVPGRRGELKHVIVTVSPAGEFMVRLVLRSTHHLAGVRKHLPALQRALPRLAVLSVNLQPEHKAVLEGPEEIVLTSGAHLRMDLAVLGGDRPGPALHLLPQSFFQTNTVVATGLYAQARAWLDALAPQRIWDLYCGVGGFALHTHRPGRVVRGIEISAAAVAAAQRSADELGIGDEVRFVAGDAAAAPELLGPDPDTVIVNPPRRGVDARLLDWLEGSAAGVLLYSSCNPATLARDLDLLGWPVRHARLFDMFPQTAHAEVLVVARREDGRATGAQPSAATAES